MKMDLSSSRFILISLLLCCCSKFISTTTTTITPATTRRANEETQTQNGTNTDSGFSSDADYVCDPEQRVDVMDSHVLFNEEQCRKLCWYRLLCTSYSFRRRTVGIDCLLHSYHVEGGNSTCDTPGHPDWTEKNVTDPNPGSACSIGRCGDRKVCVPAPLGGRTCLLRPATCPPGPVLGGAISVYERHEQNSVLLVLCPEYFVPRPKGSQISCQVNSKWTTYPGKCMQAEFFQQQDTNFLSEIPWNFVNGWAACVRGGYLGEESVRIGIFPVWCEADQISDCQHMYVSSTISASTQKEGLVAITWQSKAKGGQPESRTLAEDVPQGHNGTFFFSFQLFADRLQVNVAGYNNSLTVFTADDGGLDAFVHSKAYMVLAVEGQAELSYVHLLSKCNENMMADGN